MADLISPTEAAVFWAQSVPDLAHALKSAQAVTTAAPGRTDLARAALLHDVGKRHSEIGTIARSLATGLAVLRLPTPSRLGSYLDHAQLGATELAALGCEDLVVAFARHHHGDRPQGFGAADWEILVQADDE